MKKWFSKIHLWLSIPFGLIISILCFSGAMLVFETEIQQIIHPKRYFVEKTQEKPLPLQTLIPMVQAQLPDSITISSVSVPAADRKNYRMGMTGQGRSSLMVDPYTGEIRGKIVPYAKGNFFSGMRKMHRWLLFPYKRGEFSWGKLLTGVTTLTCLFILVSGIVVWVPRSAKSLKRRLTIGRGKGTFRFWYDLHVAGGIYTVILLLAFCLTGLTWSFDWYRNGFYKVLGAETQQTAPAPPQTGGNLSGRAQIAEQEQDPEEPSGENRPIREKTESPEQLRSGAADPGTEGASTMDRGEREVGGKAGNRRNPTLNYAVWDQVLATMKTEYPDAPAFSVQHGSASVTLNKRGNIRASDRVIFLPGTGKITEIQLHRNSERSGKIRGWIYSVHVGAWGGFFTRFLSFLACLIGTALPLTGYYFYFKKRRIKRRKRGSAAKTGMLV